MQKDHLIQLHAFLIQIRTYMQSYYGEEDSVGFFKNYDSLQIHPHEVHKSKDMQQLAIFELMKGISELLREKDPDNFDKISKTLEYYCQCLKDENGKEEK